MQGNPHLRISVKILEMGTHRNVVESNNKSDFADPNSKEYNKKKKVSLLIRIILSILKCEFTDMNSKEYNKKQKWICWSE